MVAGPDLAIATLATAVTVSVALAAAALVPALVVSAPAGMVFRYVPCVAAVTLTWNVQKLLAGTVPPVSVTLPAAPEITPPVHVVLVAGVPARTTPPGNVSVTLATVIAAALGLSMRIVSVEMPPEAMEAGVKVFA